MQYTVNMYREREIKVTKQYQIKFQYMQLFFLANFRPGDGVLNIGGGGGLKATIRQTMYK
jgi:hypothetical protein